MFQKVDDAVPVKPDLEDFWNLETIGVIDNQITKNDELVKKAFQRKPDVRRWTLSSNMAMEGRKS